MGTGKSSICFLDSFICSCSLVSSFFFSSSTSFLTSLEALDLPTLERLLLLACISPGPGKSSILVSPLLLLYLVVHITNSFYMFYFNCLCSLHFLNLIQLRYSDDHNTIPTKIRHYTISISFL